MRAFIHPNVRVESTTASSRRSPARTNQSTQVFIYLTSRSRTIKSTTRRSSRHWRWARVAARRGWAPRLGRSRGSPGATARPLPRARSSRGAPRPRFSPSGFSPGCIRRAPPPRGRSTSLGPRGASLSPSPCGTCWTARAIRRTARTSPAPRPPPSASSGSATARPPSPRSGTSPRRSSGRRRTASCDASSGR